MAGAYVPRSPTTGVLYGVVRGHWSEFATTVRERTDGVGLPTFVGGEFRKFLRCGVLAHGFVRIRCGDCAFERLLPFSCKGRGFCPSCGGRRMAERVRRVIRRLRRRLARLGIGEVAGTDGDVDPLADESEALAGLSRAAVLGRAALGRRAGHGPLRIGADPDAPWVDRHVPLHARMRRLWEQSSWPNPWSALR